MRVDLGYASRTLGFDEEKLLETASVLLEAKKRRNNIFYENGVACDYVLPKGMERGSKEHANYMLFMTILDVATDSDTLYKRGRELYETNPEFFDPKYIFGADKNNLKIRRKGPKRDDGMKDKRPRVLVAPKIDEIIKEKLGHGFHQSLSGSLHQSARKLLYMYEGDTRKIFDNVEDTNVAYRRLDMGKSAPDIESRQRYTSRTIFSGMGRKTAPLIVIKAIKSEIIKGMDKTKLFQPFDRHLYNLSLSRNIINIPPSGIRKDKITRLAQPLFRKTFSENNIDAVEFHYAQWLLGSEACKYTNCSEHTVSVRGEKQRTCPFSKPCKIYMNPEVYRKEGIVKPMEIDFF